jgi:hypothetical protein
MYKAEAIQQQRSGDARSSLYTAALKKKYNYNILVKPESAGNSDSSAPTSGGTEWPDGRLLCYLYCSFFDNKILK